MKNLSSIAVPDPLNKVPLATLAFWVIKIMSTTVGETGADYLAVNAGLGKGATSAAMAALLAIAIVAQLRSKTYTPWLYWVTVVVVSVVGTVLIAAIAAARWLGANAVLTFWLAYMLTRPLGAALGDLLSQAKTYGGVGLGPMLTRVIFLAVIGGLVAVAQRVGARGAASAPL